MPHEFNGDKYQQASSHQKEWGNKIIAEFALKGNEQILDIGCGDGILTEQLATMVPEGYVLGIDASKSMIETAKSLSRNNLSFQIKDINHLDYESRFDLVFSNATLHWVKNHNLLLRNVYRSLRENGFLRLNFAADGNCSNLIKVLTTSMDSPEFVKYFLGFEWPWYMPELKTYENLVRQSSFKKVEVWGENADRYFPNVHAMVKWIDQPSLVPFIKHISRMKEQAFRDRVVEQMIKLTKQPDGRFFETFRRINVKAWK